MAKEDYDKVTQIFEQLTEKITYGPPSEDLKVNLGQNLLLKILDHV